MDFFRRQNWDIIKYTWLWFAISALVIGVGVATWATRGLNYGIDFTGGSLLRYRFERPLVTQPGEHIQVIAQTRQMLEGLGLGKSQIQVSGTDSLYIRTPQVANDEEAAVRDEKVQEGLQKLFGEKSGAITKLGRETVGPVIGKMLTRSAIQALVLGVILILLYITIRYEFRFAVAAVIALVHDTLVLVGAVALLQIELNTWFVAALLTIIGYSINDTVVIFDRIRENRSIHRRAPLASVVNASLLQTMTRSLNTVFTTLLTLIALFLFGGATIQGFALSLIIGIASGCYSSIFTASPIVVMWHNWSERRKRSMGTTAAPRRAAAVASAGAARATGAAAPETAPADDEQQQQPARPSARETMREAERAAQEEKRQARRERRKKKSKSGKKRKRRF
ncbi:MAG: protein translocase subunit SecF [Armatimonadetes bacterium]|nr:protein translocase subunit SecF [Armatimonadota bacterium]